MDALDIQRKYLSRERTRCEIYQQIVDRCFRRIHWAVEQDHTKITFRIPPWVFGLPRYSIPECELYLMDALRGKGYVVRKVDRGLVEIDWTQYLPNRKQVREVVRYEHSQKMRAPRNRLAICDTNWLGDGPLNQNTNQSLNGTAGRGRGVVRPVLPTEAPVFSHPDSRAIQYGTPGRKQAPTIIREGAPSSVVNWKPPAPSFQQTTMNPNQWMPPPLNVPKPPGSIVSNANSKSSLTLRW
jgi:hypothetical protein